MLAYGIVLKNMTLDPVVNARWCRVPSKNYLLLLLTFLEVGTVKFIFVIFRRSLKTSHNVNNNS